MRERVATSKSFPRRREAQWLSVNVVRVTMHTCLILTRSRSNNFTIEIVDDELPRGLLLGTGLMCNLGGK